LESSHNYIQMLFPLPEGSPYNGEAPIIDLTVMNAFRSRRELRDRLRESFQRMLTFYGFQISAKSEEELKQEQQATAAELKAKAAEKPDPLLDQAAATAATQATAEEPKLTTKPYPDAAIDADPTLPKNTEPAKFAFPPGSQTNVSAAAQRDIYIIRGPNWRRASPNWVKSFDHNHLRISRILRCLRILGLQAEYHAFWKVSQFANPYRVVCQQPLLSY
jgi:hypothetical protein